MPQEHRPNHAKRIDLITGDRQSGKTTKIILGIISKAAGLAARNNIREHNSLVMVFAKDAVSCEHIEDKVCEVMDTEFAEYYAFNDALSIDREIYRSLSEGDFPSYIYIDDLNPLDLKELSRMVGRYHPSITWIVSLGD